MSPRIVFDMLLLGAIWGGAFPLLRIATPAFGPVALIAVRTSAAVLVCLALLNPTQRKALREHAQPLFVLAMLNTAIPFTLFSFATLYVNAGLASLLNATTPMFGALIAFLWLGERLTAARIAGIAIGFLGIGSIVWGQVGARREGALLGVAAGLGAAALYGLAASYARRRLSGVDPWVTAAGCVCGAALVMIPLGILMRPDSVPAWGPWLCAVMLGIVCTAYAYVIFYRLMNRVGAGRAVTVTFLIPVFGILWGALFLAEPVTPALLLSCAVVMIGTALAMGLQLRR